MIHSVLTGLPEFFDHGQVQDGVQGGNSAKVNPEIGTPEHTDCTPPLNKVGHSHTCKVPENTQNTLEADLDVRDPINGPASESFSPDLPTTCVTTTSHVGVAHVPSGSVHSALPHDEDTPSTPVISGPPVPPQRLTPIPTPPNASTFLDPADIPLPPSAPSTRSASPVSPRPTTGSPLSGVLLLADELSIRFPPGTPELRLTHTLGPASAMRTWAQDPSLMQSDDQAEALVVSGVNIVVREAPEPGPQILKEQKANKKRKHKVRREARLLVAGAVLVLGVAVVYGVRASHGGSGRRFDVIGAETEWRALVGALGALGDRVLGAFGDAHIEL